LCFFSACLIFFWETSFFLFLFLCGKPFMRYLFPCWWDAWQWRGGLCFPLFSCARFI
jgi:hypothetical protein